MCASQGQWEIVFFVTLWILVDRREIPRGRLVRANNSPRETPFLCVEIYSFLDGFSGYNQTRMAPKDQAKIAFIICLYCWIAQFAINISEGHVWDIWAIFNRFHAVFLDDLSVFGSRAKHLEHLRLCLQRCREVSFTLNPLKCAFAVRSGKLLGHINWCFSHLLKVKASEGVLIFILKSYRCVFLSTNCTASRVDQKPVSVVLERSVCYSN